MNRHFQFLVAALMLSGCTSAPPAGLSASHPASPEAAEGRRVARVTSLRADEATRKTEALLAAARKEQEHWEATGPESDASAVAPENKNQTEETHERH